MSILWQKIMNWRSDKKCVRTFYQKILKKCWPAKEVKNAWVFHTKKYFTIVVLVKNAWVFCTIKYWAEIDVQNAYVFSVSKNISRKWYKMCEYFLPTIRLSMQMSLIICRKYSRILYRTLNLSVEKRGTKCVSINKKS